MPRAPRAVAPAPPQPAGGLSLPDMKWPLMGAWGVLAFSLAFRGMPTPASLATWSRFRTWVEETFAVLIPFSWNGLASAFLKAGVRCLLITAFLIAVWGGGQVVMRWIFRRRPREDALVMSLGLVMIATFLYGLGIAGIWFGWVFLAFLGAMGAVGLLRLPWRGAVAACGRFRLGALRGVPLEGWLSLVFLGACLLVSGLPEGGEDSYLYHWGAPGYYLKFHKSVPTPYCLAWNYPLFVEMLYSVGLAFAMEEGAKLVNLAILLVLVRLMFNLTRETWGSRGSWWSAWILLGSSYVISSVWHGKNDLGLALFCLCAVLAMIRAALSGSGRWWLLAGIFTGALAATKVIGGIVMVGTVMALWMVKGEIQWTGAPPALWGALFVVLPWYLRTWFVTGNPLIPLAPPFFSNLWWGEEEQRAAFRSMRVWMDQNYLLATARMVGLWAACSSGVALAILAPFIMAFKPPGLDPRRSQERRILLIAIVLTSVIWGSSVRDPRYLLPLMPMVAFLSAAWLASPSERGLKALRVVSLLQVATLVKGLLLVAEPPAAIAYVLGQVDRSDYVRQRQTTTDAARQWVNENLGRRDGVLLVGEDRNYGYGPKVVSQVYVDQRMTWRWAKESRSAEEMRKKARQWGINHIQCNVMSACYRTVVWYEGRPWSDRQLNVYGEFMRRYSRLAYRSPHYDRANGNYFIWRIEDDAGEPARRIMFLPGAEGVVSPLSAPWAGQPIKPPPRIQLSWMQRTYERLPYVGYFSEQLAFRFFEAGALGEALAEMKPFFDMGYECDNFCGMFARGLLRQFRSEEAIKAAARAGGFCRDKENLVLLGLAYVSKALDLARQGKRRQAEPFLKMAVRISRLTAGAPEVWTVDHGIGVVLLRMKRPDEARAYVDRAWNEGGRTEDILNIRNYLASIAPVGK